MNMRKAPWPDFNGNDIFENSVIAHPSGEMGTVFFLDINDTPGEQWLVDYGDGIKLRLNLQVGDKGQACVIQGGIVNNRGGIRESEIPVVLSSRKTFIDGVEATS